MRDNRKNQLAVFLQRYVGRALRKDDVVYATQQVSESCWVSQVRLACCQGEEGQVCYSGELVPSSKAAEHSAAEQVLAAYAHEIASLPPLDPSRDAKSRLAEALQAHCKKALVKGDVVYKMTNYGGPYQATVRLAVLGGQEFCGEQCLDEKLAERAAAAVALASQPCWAPYVGPPAVAQAQGKAAPKAWQKPPPPTWMPPPTAWVIPGQPSPLTIQSAQAQGWATPAQPAPLLTKRRPAPGAAQQTLDPKTELCKFLQAKLLRALTKADVLYTTVEVPDGVAALADKPLAFAVAPSGGGGAVGADAAAAAAAAEGKQKLCTSSVVLVCLEGALFQGPLVLGRKAAEQAAAAEALAAYELERAALPPPKRQRQT